MLHRLESLFHFSFPQSEYVNRIKPPARRLTAATCHPITPDVGMVRGEMPRGDVFRGQQILESDFLRDPLDDAMPDRHEIQRLESPRPQLRERAESRLAGAFGFPAPERPRPVREAPWAEQRSGHPAIAGES